MRVRVRCTEAEADRRPKWKSRKERSRECYKSCTIENRSYLKKTQFFSLCNARCDFQWKQVNIYGTRTPSHTHKRGILAHSALELLPAPLERRVRAYTHIQNWKYVASDSRIAREKSARARNASNDVRPNGKNKAATRSTARKKLLINE